MCVCVCLCLCVYCVVHTVTVFVCECLCVHKVTGNFSEGEEVPEIEEESEGEVWEQSSKNGKDSNFASMFERKDG